MFLVQHILFNTFNSKVYSRPQHGTHSVGANLLSSRYYKQCIIIIDMQLYTLIFCSIISVTYQVFIIINGSSRLVQCLRILDVNRKVEERRGPAGGGRKEGGREADRGRVWSGGEHGVREGGSVGVYDGGRKITAGQRGMKRK